MLKEGIKADAIHGDKSQKERMVALEAFKNGEVEVLVATDVAARGLDIVELPCVINYDLPHSPEDYVHRIGRTGRAGASGDAISLMSKEEERYLLDIEKLTGTPIVRADLEGFDPDRSRLRERGDRTERSERGSREERPPRAEGGYRDRERTPARHASPRQAPVDEWFLKPYQPDEKFEASVEPVVTNQSKPLTGKSVERRPTVAALFSPRKPRTEPA